jgi:hypothetical protein
VGFPPRRPWRASTTSSSARSTTPGNLQQAFPFDAPSQTFEHLGAGGSVAWGDLATRSGLAVNRVGLTARDYADPAVRDVDGGGVLRWISA